MVDLTLVQLCLGTLMEFGVREGLRGIGLTVPLVLYATM